MNKCPFCERENAAGALPSRTEVIPPEPGVEDDKTRPIGSPSLGGKPSEASSGSGDESTRQVPSSGAPRPHAGSDERTVIHRPSGTNTQQPSSSRRKLEGWLVSFSMDPAGVDFKLFEGKNLIGRSSECDIKLIHDSKISSKHALIVFRNGDSVFADEMASNESYINDEVVGLGDKVRLSDGARIKMGDHEFIFRKVIS